LTARQHNPLHDQERSKLMDLQHVKQIIAERYGQLSATLIEQVRNAPAPEPLTCEQSLWASFVAEVQKEDPLYFSVHEAAINALGRQLITPLSETECRLLWLGSSGYANWIGGRNYDFPAREALIDDVVAELFAWVEQAAGEEES